MHKMFSLKNAFMISTQTSGTLLSIIQWGWGLNSFLSPCLLIPSGGQLLLMGDGWKWGALKKLRSGLKADWTYRWLKVTEVFYHLNLRYLSWPVSLTVLFFISTLSWPVSFYFIWPHRVLLHFLFVLFRISFFLCLPCYCSIQNGICFYVFFPYWLILTILTHDYFRWRTHLIIVPIWNFLI